MTRTPYFFKWYALLFICFFYQIIDTAAQSNQCYSGHPANGCYNADWIFYTTNAQFKIKPGTTADYKEYSNGTAKFTATVIQTNDANKQLYLDLNLTGYKNYSANPHGHDCQSPNTSAWHYYTNTSGTATGQNALQGITGYISQGSYPWWQVGNGANTNSMGFGASSWLHCDWTGHYPDGQVDVECNLNPINSGQVSVNNATICQGQSATLTASGCTGSVKWSTGQSSTSISVTPGTSTSYIVTCQGQCGTSTATAYVTVIPNPSVSANNNGPFCNAQNVQLTATANQTGTYYWTGPNGFTSFSQNPSGNLVAGTYNVVFTNTAGCKAYASTNIVITNEPVPNISVGPANCPNTPITISAFDPSFSFSYNWSFGLLASPSSASNLGPHQVTYPTCGTRTITLTFQKPTCKGAVSTQVSVVDNQKPIITGVPSNISQECSQPIPPVATPSVTDNCDRNIQLNFTEYKTYPNTCTTVINRKWSATDKCANYTEAIQTITLIDTKAPVLNNVPSDLNLGANDVVPSVPTNITATDDCDPATIPVFSQTESIVTCTKTIKRTWTAKDRCGNSTAKIQNITITKPITCTASIYQNISTNGGNNGIAQVTASGGWGWYSYKWSNGASGQYAYFLTAGTYTVTVTDNYGCSCVSSVTLGNPAKLGDLVFEDKNGNGVQDAGEAGVFYAKVTLTGTDINGSAVTKVLYTDYYGKYCFEGLSPGTYCITVDPPAGYLVTSKDKGGNDTKDSDIDPITRKSQNVTLSAGQANLDLDAGLFKPAKIGDYVWNDVNKDGIQFFETGVAGVNVMLLGTKGDGTPVNLSTTTDANGKYLFDNLTPGIYCVKFTAPSGFTLSPKDGLYFGIQYDDYDSDADPITGKTIDYTLTSGQSNLTVDAGIYKPPFVPASLGDCVYEDKNGNGIQDSGETGVAGITVILINTASNVSLNTTTDTNGKYLFSNLNPGTYCVVFSIPATYKITAKDKGTDDAKDSDADLTTGKTGNYTLTSGQNNLTVDAGIYKPACLGDFVFEDKNRDGIQGSNELGFPNLTVQLTGTTNAGEQIALVTSTNTNGIYKFVNLAPGTYCIKVNTPLGYLFSSSDQGNDDTKDSDIEPSSGKSPNVSLVSGQNYLNLDAGIFNKFDPVQFIGDCVFNDFDADGLLSEGEQGIPNVTVQLLNSQGVVLQTTITNAQGKYSFSGVGAGVTYCVRFIAPSAYQPTTSNAFNNTFDDKDSDIDATGKTNTFVLNTGESKLTIDAGFKKPCDNFTYPGTICCNQAQCTAFDPTPLNSTSLPTGGTGAIQYLWLITTDSPSGAQSWATIPNTNSISYNPPTVNQTTYIRRCARREGCPEVVETTPIELKVKSIIECNNTSKVEKENKNKEVPNDNITPVSQKEVELRIYPNPANGNFTIDFGEEKVQEVNIYTLTGTNVYSTNIDAAQIKIDISLEAIQANHYFIQLKTKDKIINKRIMIVK